MEVVSRFMAGLLAMVTVGSSVDFGSETVTLWHPYLEWSIDNVSYSGNGYDVVATVAFEHDGSDARHETEMFFDGNDTWKFRFTGTKTGNWTFSTSSDNADLNGHSGEVNVTPNPDKSIPGFLVASGNKFAVQTGESGDLKAITGHIFFPFGMEDGWHAHPHKFLENLDAIMANNEKYGFRRYFMSEVCNAWFKLGVKGHDGHNSDEPDRATFEAIEQAIVKLHENGHSLHIWSWGDEARRWTPKGVSGGTNGYADRRVQRYIAARLGPLPNWTMGYGFDLHEWAGEDGLRSWAEYLHERMGWPHLIWARARSNSELDVLSYADMCHDYNAAVNNLNSDSNRPHLFEERDLYKRNCADMNWTRTHLWRYTLAGGHAGFFGQYFNNKAEYPNPEQIKTFFTFWRDNNRLLLDMEADNGLSNGYCLITPGKTHAVFYKENTSSVEMKLSGFNGTVSAVAVDTKKDYEEVTVEVSKSDMSWDAPRSSDWAIAVGEFEEEPVSVARNAQQAGVAHAPVQARHTGNMLEVTGLSMHRAYTVTLIDTRGRVSTIRETSGPRGRLSIPTANRSPGVYVVTAQTSRERLRTIAVLY